MTKTKIAYLKNKALWVRQQTLKMACGAGEGHIASSFSCTEIMVCLYQGGVLNVDPKHPKWSERDRFILSKGQAALALYPILADMGFFSVNKLCTFAKNGSILGAHADDAVPGVDIHTGSLGHGLSIGCGLAFAARMDRKRYLTFVLLGDGECQEGSIWESAMFAGHHKLTNLIAIVDNNRLSASDHLDKYLSLKSLSKKFGSFGWKAVQVDGHSIPQILNVLKGVHNRKARKPLAIIANTVKGKGIRMIENRADWHYRVPVGKELESACKEVGLRLDFINK